MSSRGFDSLISSADIHKVLNGATQSIKRTSDLPAPIFAGVNNATAIQNATDSV